jgi:hypothetical protein
MKPMVTAVAVNGGFMARSITHMILNALNSSEAHIGYASWFYAPDLVSMFIFFATALMATIHLMLLGEKV